jgi:hypothetical protein
MSRPMKILLRVIFYGFLLLILVPFFVPGPLRVAVALIFGWVSFLGRTLPKVTLSWSGIGMAAVCSVVIVVAIHSFCSWLARTRSGAAWRWRSSVAIYGLGWGLFMMTMAVTGIIHQTAWLATSDERWLVRREPNVYGIIQFSHAVENALEEHDWKAEPGQTNLWNEIDLRAYYSREMSREALHTVFFPPEGTITNVLIFHRDPKVRERIGFWTLNRSEGGDQKPWNEIGHYLPELKSARTGE